MIDPKDPKHSLIFKTHIHTEKSEKTAPTPSPVLPRATKTLAHTIRSTSYALGQGFFKEVIHTHPHPHPNNSLLYKQAFTNYKHSVCPSIKTPTAPIGVSDRPLESVVGVDPRLTFFTYYPPSQGEVVSLDREGPRVSGTAHNSKAVVECLFPGDSIEPHG